MDGIIGKKQRTELFIICSLLAVLVWAVFGQTLQHDFVNYDDDAYVYENPVVLNGFSIEGIKEVFTSENRGIHYPLTMLSFMLDREFQGMEPGGFHRTNVLLHAATVIALFLILRQTTGSLWRSAFVAALFAIHPLRVESVAWITERKDVLSGLFSVLAIGAYLGYARRPFSTLRYALVGLLFALALLAKPSVAPLPALLLLLDYWPLRRWSRKTLRRIILEKIPLLCLSALAVSQATASHALLSIEWEAPSLPWRIGNALVAYVVYLRQTIWPVGLAPHYPHPGTDLPLWEIAGALLLLAAISAAVLWQGKKRPWLLVGWFWYLGMLLPTIGIVRVLGEAAHADRFTYLPQTGLCILLAWCAAEGASRLRLHRAALPIIGTLLLALFAATARHQTTHWKDSLSLWNHTLAHTEGNDLAHNNLALALEDEGDWKAAIRHYEKAIRIRPEAPHANHNLGLLLSGFGKTAEAIPCFRRAIRGNPDRAEPWYGLGAALASRREFAEALPSFEEAIRLDPTLAAPRFGMGTALAAQGKPREAIPCFEQAIRLGPNVAAPHLGLGRAWATQGKFDKAIPHLQEALRLQPDDPMVRDMLQRVLAAQEKQNRNPADTACQSGLKMQAKGEFSEAVQQYRQALRIDPDHYEAKNNLAWLLATCPEANLRNGDRAVELAEQVVQQVGEKNTFVLDTLAAAYAEAGRYPEAVETARRAVEILIQQGAASDGIHERIALYQAGHPFHEPDKSKQ